MGKDSRFLINGLKDPHNWEGSNHLFASLILDLLSARDIRNSLSRFHPAADWVLHATMFFDRNQATEPHEDIYYIDSNPSGACLGFWLALEDIDERAGRFFFVEGSHKASAANARHPMDLENAEHLKIIEEYTNRNRNRLVAPDLRKGDALIWHGRTIHGALPVMDERFSRKSLTAHFVDSERVGRNRFRDFTSVEIRRFNDLRYVAAIRPDEEAFAPAGAYVRDVKLPGGSYRFLGIDRAGGDRVVLALEAMILLTIFLFARIEKIKQEEIQKGRKLIALGIGDPDLPTPEWVMNRLNWFVPGMGNLAI